jgi:hypothetical protein
MIASFSDKLTTMNSNDGMMMHMLMQDEAGAFADKEEKLMDISCLLGLRANMIKSSGLSFNKL